MNVTNQNIGDNIIELLDGRALNNAASVVLQLTIYRQCALGALALPLLSVHGRRAQHLEIRANGHPSAHCCWSKWENLFKKFKILKKPQNT